MDDYYAENMNL